MNDDEYSFMNADKLVKKFEESRKTFHREGGGSNYFTLDLVLGDYNPDKLVKLAHERGQIQALGYVCDVAAESLPNEEAFKYVKLNLRNLSDNLYSFCDSDSEWQYLSMNSPNAVKRIIRNRKQTPLNKKWHIYSPLNQNEMTEWFRVYRDDLTEILLQNAS